MSTSKEEKNIFYREQKYKDNYVTLIPQCGKEGRKLVYTDKEYENLYVVDIIIRNGNKQYNYSNYYIALDVEEINNNAIAERIVSRMNTITLSDGRFIGRVIEFNGKQIVVGDNLIALSLLQEKHSTTDDAIYKIYEEYRGYIKSGNQDLVLKYAAFLELYFTKHPIPDAIRDEYYKEANIKNPIIDYDMLNKAIVDSLKGKTVELHTRFQEINENRDELLSLDSDINKLAKHIKICEEILRRIDEFLNKKRVHDENETEKRRLQEDYEKIPFYNIKRFNDKRSLKRRISQLDDSEFNRQSEESKIKAFIIKISQYNIIENFTGLSIEEIRKRVHQYYTNQNDEYKTKVDKYEKILRKERKHNPNASIEALGGELLFDDLYLRLEDSTYLEEDNRHK